MNMFEKDKDLAPLTTFGVPASCKLFAEYADVRQLTRIFRSEEFRENEVLHIGGGSNLLFVKRFNGLVLHSAIRGIRAYDKDSETCFVIAGAGEKWTDLVEWTLEQGLAGLENLAGIPGEVGAAPVQNVGAYGREAGELIHAVECFDTETGKTLTIPGSDCGFAYRDSNFKNQWKGKLIVLRVGFRLKRSDKAECLAYGPLKELENRLGHRPTPREVAEEVVRLRDSKLPNPREVGSAGSFFKNPVVNAYWFREEVLNRHPEVPYYELDDNRVKIPAGWLIEHSGLKGARSGGAEVWPRQCLVIANSGGATAADVCSLSKRIVETVAAKFNVRLEPEVNFIDTSMTVTILGSGTSKGVPEIGCNCQVCRSEDPRDKRLRASVLIRTRGLNILIDPSPDFRQQMLREGVDYLDAILLTHSHYDHVGGLDDVRPLDIDSKMEIYLSEDVDRDLRKRLDYCFRPNPYPGVPQFRMNVIQNRAFDVKGVEVLPIRVLHGSLPIFGFRIGDFAYVTDAKTVPEEEMWKLEGLDVMVLNALRDKPHFSHLNVEEALAIVKEAKPRETYLTHICHHMGLHAEKDSMLPSNVHLAYDGLRLEFN